MDLVRGLFPVVVRTSGKDKHAKPGDVSLSAASDFGEKHLRYRSQRRSKSGGSQPSRHHRVFLSVFSLFFSPPMNGDSLRS